jgi:hypothetical protein
MTRQRNVSILLMSVITIIILVSCTSPSENLAIEITDIGWMYENIDYLFWTSPSYTASCYGQFFIYYTGSEITALNLQSVEMNHIYSGRTWNFNLDPSNIDITNHCIGVFPNRFYSSYLSSNGSVFPIGPFLFTIILTNGNECTFTFDAPAPGSLTSNSKQFIFNEDYSGTIDSNYIQTIKKATIGTRTKDASSIQINFTINDPLFYNGFIWFYDNSNTYIGKTSYFRIIGTGALSTIINGGSTLYTDGNNNVVNLQSSNITFFSGYSFSQITKFAIVLTDGAQYAGTNHTYDCRSITATTSF